MKFEKKIGFMQGRLSDLILNKIQAFPKTNWENEFSEASSIGLGLMEWTVDYEDLDQNPLMLKAGRRKIKNLCKEFKMKIPSLTADCFMQKPFWKADSKEMINLKKMFQDVLTASFELGIEIIVVPLVDNGKLENSIQEKILLNFLEEYFSNIKNMDLKILFESDYEPSKLKTFIEKLPEDFFGINYDIGNSAALGHDPEKEFKLIGERIKNVHVKDRKFNGETIELGKGDADFNLVFKKLKDIDFKGNFILQTARAKDNNHKKVLVEYKQFTLGLLSSYFV